MPTLIAAYGEIPLPDQAFVEPNGLPPCGCGNIPESGGCGQVVVDARAHVFPPS